MTTHHRETPPSTRLKVAVYQLLIPNYRHGFFRELSRCPDLDVSICSPNRSEDANFSKIDDSCKEFRHVQISVWKWRLGFRRKKRELWFYPSQVRHALKRTYDVTVVSAFPGELSTWITLLLARLLRRPVCIWGKGKSPDSRLLNGMMKWMIRLSSAVIFYDDEARDFWIARGANAKKLFVANNALDTHVSDQLKKSLSPERLEAFQQTHGLAAKKILIYTGRLVPRKRPEMIVLALAEIRKKIPNAHAVIIGDGPEREGLEELAESLGLTECVTFTGSIFDEEVLACYWLSSQVAVMPSAAGLAVQHAFAYDIPIIIAGHFSSHGPEAALVVSGETGVRCEGETLEELVGAIETVLSDDALRETMSRNARKVIKEKYNVDKMTDGMRRAILFASQDLPSSLGPTHLRHESETRDLSP